LSQDGWKNLARADAAARTREPEVWVENRRRQREQKQEVRAPLLAIFKPALLKNTLTACWWMAGTLVVYYSVYSLFAT
jgi:SHS family lactate transporter-like MFS transporter